MPIQPKFLCSTLMLLGGVAAAAPGGAFDEITITATKVATPLLEVPATVSVIDNASAERRLDRDLKDLVRYDPNVSVRNNLARFGLSDFNIRGMGGNRTRDPNDLIREQRSSYFGGSHALTCPPQPVGRVR
jgi:hemoglobin/transferrin/lactoferrin receptor protein